MRGYRTIRGPNGPKNRPVYRGQEYIRVFNSSAPSPSSQASSIEEDNHISYGSYVPNDYSLSFSADTIKTMEPVLHETTKTNDTFFSKRLLQLKEFRQLHNVDTVEDVVDSQNGSSLSSPNYNTYSQNTSQESIDVIEQTGKLPTVIRKDFVDNVYTLMVLSQSKKSEDGQGSKNPTTNVIGDLRSPETFGVSLDNNGLRDFIQKIQSFNGTNDDIRLVEMENSDIERSPVVIKVLEMYEPK